MSRLKRATIEAAEPKDKLYSLMDDEVRGFGVRIHPATKRHPNGRRTFFIRTYPQGSSKECRTHLGEYGLVTIEQARAEAIRHLAIADQGEFPSEVKKRKREEDAVSKTVREGCELYVAEHVARHCSPTTLQNIKSRFSKWVIPIVGSLELNAITRQDVSRMHAKVGATSPGAANHTVRELSAVLTWCQGMGYREPDLANPCKRDRRGVAGVRMFSPQRTRERVLQRTDIESLFRVLDDYEDKRRRGKMSVHPDLPPLIRLLFYTGARLSELHRLKYKNALEDRNYLRWSQVDLEARCIHLSRTKEKKPKAICLSDQALAILRAHRERKEQEGRLGEPVFECYNPGRPWRNLIVPKAGLGATEEQRAFTLHGLRHNFLSYGAMAGMPREVLKKLAGHAGGGGVTDGYTHFANAFLIKAAQTVCDALDGLRIE